MARIHGIHQIGQVFKCCPGTWNVTRHSHVDRIKRCVALSTELFVCSPVKRSHFLWVDKVPISAYQEVTRIPRLATGDML